MRRNGAGKSRSPQRHRKALENSLLFVLSETTVDRYNQKSCSTITVKYHKHLESTPPRCKCTVVVVIVKQTAGRDYAYQYNIRAYFSGVATTIAVAQTDTNIFVPDPCDKPCITEISTVPWQGPALRPQPKVVTVKMIALTSIRKLMNNDKAGRRQPVPLSIRAGLLTTRTAPDDRLSCGILALGRASLCEDEPFGRSTNNSFLYRFYGWRGFNRYGRPLLSRKFYFHCVLCIWIFGWRTAVNTRLTFLESEVYQGIEIVSYASSGDYDHSVVRVDRTITAPDAQPFIIRREGTIQVDEYVGVIGHPSGLPMKIAFGDTMCEVQAPQDILWRIWILTAATPLSGN